jgi:hypothetical protein
MSLSTAYTRQMLRASSLQLRSAPGDRGRPIALAPAPSGKALLAQGESARRQRLEECRVRLPPAVAQAGNGVDVEDFLLRGSGERRGEQGKPRGDAHA